jgi:hypothetical protein
VHIGEQRGLLCHRTRDFFYPVSNADDCRASGRVQKAPAFCRKYEAALAAHGAGVRLQETPGEYGFAHRLPSAGYGSGLLRSDPAIGLHFTAERKMIPAAIQLAAPMYNVPLLR